jgi:carboxyl-terminal processing protease
MKKRFSVLSVVLLCALALIIGTQINVISGDNIYEQLTKFKDVLSLAQKDYVDTVDTGKMVENAITGMLSHLDPHSVYIPASQLSKINEDFQGNFEGIGVEFDVVNDTILIVSPVPGGPSEALGIRSGDRIVKINDSIAIGMKREDVPKKLRGPKGTHVKVSIFRAGEKGLADYDIVRDKIPLYSVDVSFMTNDEIGYISINRFSQTTHDEFVSAITKLKAQGMKKLIVDLRGNPGGYLDQAYKMADEMLPKGKKVVFTKGRRPEFDEEYISSGGGHLTNMPIIVLIDHGSASASEIVSGAVQDWDRGLIVGVTSFGKGLVQRQFTLSDNSAFRLTIARYYTPSGRCIQRPYGSSLEEYERQAFEKDEAEGENVDHKNDADSSGVKLNASNVKNALEKKSESDSARPLYKTAGGRPVYGGGGITPDYIVKAGKLTAYTANLLRKNLFLDVVTTFMEANKAEIQNKYGAKVQKFIDDYSVSDDLVTKLTDLAAKKDVKMVEDDYKKDLPYIKTYLKAYVARNIWSTEGWRRTFATMDTQFQKALALFPEAGKLAGRQ